MPDSDAKPQTTIPPAMAVVKLYDLVLGHMAEAARHATGGDIEAQAREIQAAVAILSGLDSCLDMQAGGQVASNLRDMYQSMARTLQGAVGQPDAVLICEKLAEGFRQTRDAWAESAGAAV